MRSIFSTGFLLLVCTSTVSSNPVELKTRAISERLLDELEFISQYAAAAYCKGNNDSPGSKIVCPAGNCPRVEKTNTSTLLEFENSSTADTTGYLAYDYTNSQIILAFRGSRSINNWMTNFAYRTTKVPSLCPSCAVSSGFWNAWLEVNNTVVPALKQAHSRHPQWRIIITGHSLGGALAAIATVALRTQGLTVNLYSYGAPKIGRDGLSYFMYKQPHRLGRSFRVTHLYDPVPKMPPVSWGYEHWGVEYYITVGSGVEVKGGDVEVLRRGYEESGNEYDLGSDVKSHLSYFGEVSKCEGTDFQI